MPDSSSTTEPLTEAEAPPQEVYTCETCSKEVRAERVLVLTANGEVQRHPDCHDFGKAMR